MTEELTVDLRGTGLAPGEIGLSELASLGAALQRIATRIARETVGRGGPGRSPGAVERAAQLRLRSVRDGSVLLGVAMGQEASSDLDLERQMIDRLYDVVHGFGHDSVPAWVTPLVGEAAVELVEALARTASECEFRSGRWQQSVTFRPARVDRAIWTGRAGAARSEGEREVAGRLEAVDLKPPGRFRLRDDVGNAIPLERVRDVEEAGGLIGARVIATGEAALGPDGRVLRLTAPRLAPLALPEWALTPHAAAAVHPTSGPPLDGVEGVSDAEIGDFLTSIRG